jgi:hypothetical protein
MLLFCLSSLLVYTSALNESNKKGPFLLTEAFKSVTAALSAKNDSSSRAEMEDSAATSHSYDLASQQKFLFRVLILAVGLLKAVDSRYSVTGDGISYIEMGDAYFRRDWSMAINAYWSPLYSWLIMLPKHLFGLSLHQESTSIHSVNFLIFAFVLYCFESFLDALISGLAAPSESSSPLPAWALRVIGYALFLYSALNWLSTDAVTPDLLVEGIVLLASGVLIRIRHSGTTWGNCSKLGIILGVGYLTKVVLFPLAFVFFLACFFAARKFRHSVLKISFGFVIFSLICAPYIFLLSHAKGRFTYGDTGKLAYATYVNGLPRGAHWQGEFAHSGTPLHPTRKIFDNPAMFEFAQPIGGSYPAWYDPTYWYEGVVTHLDLRKELFELHVYSHVYVDLIEAQGEFIAALFALCLIAPRFKSFLYRWAKEFYLWAPAFIAMLGYALIHVETRFLPGFLLIFWLSLFAAVSIPDSAASRKVVWCVSMAIALTAGVRILHNAFYEVGRVSGHQINIHWDVAEQLRQLGVRPGDKVASIGSGFDAYWAHLAGVTIVAEIPESDAGNFWMADPETKAKVFSLFEKYGAKAVVCNRVQQFTYPPGWTHIGRSIYFTKSLADAPIQ